MQPTKFLIPASIVWITYAMPVPDIVISASFAKNDNELLIVSGLTSLSGFLTKSYYSDQNCQTLIHTDGTKINACIYSLSTYMYTRTTVNQNQISAIEYTDVDCTIESSTLPAVAYTDGACTAALTAYRVSATRDVSTPGFMTRLVNKTC